MSEKLPVSLFVRLGMANLTGIAAGLVCAYLVALAFPSAPALLLFLIFGVVGLLVGLRIARRVT